MIKLNDLDFKIVGLEELEDKMIQAIRTYPDLAEKHLRQSGTNFRRDVVAEEKSVVKDDESVKIKKKITSNQGFEVSKTRGYNENMEIDIKAKAPHFHLVENGHEQVTATGEVIGWVEGNHVVQKIREKYKNHVMPFVMDNMLKDIIKESGLD